MMMLRLHGRRPLIPTHHPLLQRAKVAARVPDVRVDVVAAQGRVVPCGDGRHVAGAHDGLAQLLDAVVLVELVVGVRARRSVIGGAERLADVVLLCFG